MSLSVLCLARRITVARVEPVERLPQTGSHVGTGDWVSELQGQGSEQIAAGPDRVEDA